MAQTIRTRLRRLRKKEQEVHVISNPREEYESLISKTSQHKHVSGDDYESQLTAQHLRPNSRWLIVRRNLHRIRSMGQPQPENPGSQISLPMILALRRAQKEIKNIDKEENFQAVKTFILAVDDKRTRTYDTSHVKPDDALIYDRLGDEPVALQNLLYYFSRQDVSHGSLFWDFLNEVNRVLNMKRKRTKLVERLRKLAFILAIILYSIIGFMLVTLIIGVISTATKMNDPEVRWMEPNVAQSSKI